MISRNNKLLYKVISLLIKTIILLLSFFYIWKKIKTASLTPEYFNFINDTNSFYLILVCLLMPVNWGIEALKWKILISPLESISFAKSLKSIFSGVTISIFSPNRVGEFAGRIFFLEKADKIQASIKSIVGSIIQLSVTLIIGLISTGFYYYKGFDLNYPVVAFKDWDVNLFLNITVGILTCLLIMYLTKKYFSVKIKSYLNLLFDTQSTQVFLILGLSFLRYSVFSIQYYLTLKIFNIHLDFSIALMLIAITFLVTSAIPTFAISEIAVRGATAVYFFSAVTTDSAGIVAASLLLWIINLAFPALIGGVYVWKLKFFKE